VRRTRPQQWRLIGDDVAADVAGDVLEPDAVAAAAGDFAIGDPDVASTDAMHEAAPRRQRDAAASSVMLVRPMLSAPSPDSIDAPPLKTNLVVPRTPISCVPLCRRSIPVR